jgi:hypothetical protein
MARTETAAERKRAEAVKAINAKIKELNDFKLKLVEEAKEKDIVDSVDKKKESNMSTTTTEVSDEDQHFDVIYNYLKKMELQYALEGIESEVSELKMSLSVLAKEDNDDDFDNNVDVDHLSLMDNDDDDEDDDDFPLPIENAEDLVNNWLANESKSM